MPAYGATTLRVAANYSHALRGTGRLLGLYAFATLLRKVALVGLSGLEPPTSRLSGVRSNRLSYRPMQGFQV